MKKIKIGVAFLIGALTLGAECGAAEPNISVFAKFVRMTAKERGVSLSAAADLLYAAGVRGYDCGPDEPDLDELAATKLKPVNFYFFPDWFNTDIHDWERGYTDRTKPTECLNKAKKYGIPRIMVVPPNFTDGKENEAEFGKILAHMKAFVAEAKAAGITITIEDFGGTANPCSYAKYLKRFLTEIPDLKFALDTGNLVYAGRGEDILDMLEFAKGRIGHVHLKDQPKANPRAYVTLGQGAVPNEKAVKGVAAQGYDGWYTLEEPVGDTYLDTVRQVAVLKGWLASAMSLKVSVLPGEGWWGGATTFGTKAPYGLKASALDFDIRSDNYSNQTVPFMVSTKGRYVWSEKAFAVSLKDGVLTFEGDAPIELVEAGKTLREAFLAAAKKHFPASGKTPDLALIAKPQWNTWVELTYNQNQKDILAYAKAIEANGFPAGGVIMIDDTWQYGYGIWQFDPRRFADPKAMTDELHALGYKVMMWVVPFVSMDSPGYREMAHGMLDAGVKCEKGGLVLQSKQLNFDQYLDARPFAWWNGKSAYVDYTHPRGCAWFARELKRLCDDYGVDGFKFDSGDYGSGMTSSDTFVTYKPTTGYELSEAYAKIGLQFPLNEYRACYKMGGQPIVQRLCDKGHDWQAIEQLIPDMMNCGLLGHPFVCPDMIGSGSWTAFLPAAPHPYEPEIFVRSAQIHALAPMMQFSAAPWRMLKGEAFEAVKAAAWTRMKFADYILSVAKDSAQTGEPMLRAMEYEFPGQGAEKLTDQFMMGSKLLVAPQTKKGGKTRTVFIPSGTWTADDGSEVTGPKTIEVATPLTRLPYFFRK